MSTGRDLELYQGIADREGLRLFPIRGDSMEPTVKRGDFVLVKPMSTYDGEGCYVLADHFGPALHRVECLFGKARIMADNPRYSTYEIPREKCVESILAKAVFKLNVMDRRYVPDDLRF